MEIGIIVLLAVALLGLGGWTYKAIKNKNREIDNLLIDCSDLRWDLAEHRMKAERLFKIEKFFNYINENEAWLVEQLEVCGPNMVLSGIINSQIVENYFPYVCIKKTTSYADKVIPLKLQYLIFNGKVLEEVLVEQVIHKDGWMICAGLASMEDIIKLVDNLSEEDDAFYVRADTPSLSSSGKGGVSSALSAVNALTTSRIPSLDAVIDTTTRYVRTQYDAAK